MSLRARTPASSTHAQCVGSVEARTLAQFNGAAPVSISSTAAGSSRWPAGLCGAARARRRVASAAAGRAGQKPGSLTSHASFHFHLRARGAVHRDGQGIEMPNPAAAHEHALAVAQELMLHSDFRMRQWSLRVESEGGEAPFDLYFADVDPRLVPYPPQVRITLSENCRHFTASPTCSAPRETLVESRMLMARVQRRPQLVSAN